MTGASGGEGTGGGVGAGSPVPSQVEQTTIQPAGCSMDGSSKQKRAHHAGDDAEDRLSSLPDALLHTIMSFMKARQVVQTCVLAKRWRHLWRSVPCLNLDLEEFQVGDKGGLQQEGPQERSLRQQEECARFEDFTDSLLCCHNIAIPLLETFRLRTGSVKSVSSARWFRRAIKHHPSWSLKRLHLSNVRLIDQFKKHIVSGCPALKDLQLKRCSNNPKEIASSALNKLVIDSSEDFSDDSFSLSTPNLTSLRLRIRHCREIKFFRVVRMPYLVDASVCLGTSAENQLKFLGSLWNVTSLELLNFRAVEPDCESLKFPVFENLITLCLRNCTLTDDFQTLGRFLKNSPYLEKLTLGHCTYSSDFNEGKKKAMSKNTSSSQSKNLLDVPCDELELTEIFFDKDDVRLLVEFLLDNSLNLINNTIKLTRADPFS